MKAGQRGVIQLLIRGDGKGETGARVTTKGDTRGQGVGVAEMTLGVHPSEEHVLLIAGVDGGVPLPRVRRDGRVLRQKRNERLQCR